jgi:hypothetical protein
MVIMAIAVPIVVPLVIVVMLTFLMIVTRRIFGRSNEIDGPIAGMILMTVLAPVLRVLRRYV